MGFVAGAENQTENKNVTIDDTDTEADKRKAR
jgi:hypothetical protein